MVRADTGKTFGEAVHAYQRGIGGSGGSASQRRALMTFTPMRQNGADLVKVVYHNERSPARTPPLKRTGSSPSVLGQQSPGSCTTFGEIMHAKTTRGFSGDAVQ